MSYAPPRGLAPLLRLEPGSRANPIREFTEKKSWWGCGGHIPGVMKSIAPEDRCSCEPKVEKDGTKYPPMAAKAD